MGVAYLLRKKMKRRTRETLPVMKERPAKAESPSEQLLEAILASNSTHKKNQYLQDNQARVASMTIQAMSEGVPLRFMTFPEAPREYMSFRYPMHLGIDDKIRQIVKGVRVRHSHLYHTYDKYAPTLPHQNYAITLSQMLYPFNDGQNSRCKFIDEQWPIPDMADNRYPLESEEYVYQNDLWHPYSQHDFSQRRCLFDWATELNLDMGQNSAPLEFTPC